MGKISILLFGCLYIGSLFASTNELGYEKFCLHGMTPESMAEAFDYYREVEVSADSTLERFVHEEVDNVMFRQTKEHLIFKMLSGNQEKFDLTYRVLAETEFYGDFKTIAVEVPGRTEPLRIEYGEDRTGNTDMKVITLGLTVNQHLIFNVKLVNCE